MAVAPPQRLPLVHFLRVIERHLATTFLCRRHCACLAAVGWRLVVVEELTTSEASNNCRVRYCAWLMSKA